MKALILAAGYGKRLQPITSTMPKSMVEVNGTPLLINTLNILAELGFNEVGVIIGHMADYIKNAVGTTYKKMNISYFENSRFLETNNIVSLYQALDFLNDDMLMLECDIYFHKEMLEKLLQGEGECSILVSPFNTETMDGSVVRAEGDRALELILGKWQEEGFDYSDKLKTVNVYRFSKEFAMKYGELVRWYVENMSENSYYEKVLGSLMYYREFDFRVVIVSEDMWCEIDDATDLARARKRFNRQGV